MNYTFINREFSCPGVLFKDVCSRFVACGKGFLWWGKNTMNGFENTKKKCACMLVSKIFNEKKENYYLQQCLHFVQRYFKDILGKGLRLLCLLVHSLHYHPKDVIML